MRRSLCKRGDYIDLHWYKKCHVSSIVLLIFFNLLQAQEVDEHLKVGLEGRVERAISKQAWEALAEQFLMKRDFKVSTYILIKACKVSPRTQGSKAHEKTSHMANVPGSI